MLRRWCVVAVLLACPGLGSAKAADIHLGWTHADVGLHEDGDGLLLGVSGRFAPPEQPWALVYGIEYLQKAGTQPTAFSDRFAGFTIADATVRLHCLQPLVLGEYRIGAGRYGPRPYAGFSLVLKVSEAWSDFPGTPSTALGYKDLDGAGHLGVVQPLGPVQLDLRYSHGLAGQLLEDPSAIDAARKADDPLPGVADPEFGSRLTQFQVVLRVGF